LESPGQVLPTANEVYRPRAPIRGRRQCDQ
jgi:hypothetical protein